MRIFFLLFLLVIAQVVSAQVDFPVNSAASAGRGIYGDTIIAYDVATGMMSEIPPPAVDTTKAMDFTSSYSLINEQELPSGPPLFPFKGEEISEIRRLTYFLETDRYPVTAAAALFKERLPTIDSTRHWCSSILVGPDVILTAAHCVRVFGSYSTPDGWWKPAFVAGYDGVLNKPFVNGATAKTVYIFKDAMKNSPSRDIALIHLNEPVGYNNGWIGYGFDDSDSAMFAREFHNISYPGEKDLCDTAKKQMPGELYYAHGKLKCVSQERLGTGFCGIPGMSGSSIFSKIASQYVSYGVASFTHCGSQFQRIDRNTFYAFKNIQENHIGFTPNPYKAGDPNAGETEVTVGPNPSADVISINFKTPSPTLASVTLYDIYHTEIKRVDLNLQAGSHQQQVELSQLPPGMYLLRTDAGKLTSTTKVIKVN